MIGMTESDVQTILRAKPLESGKCKHGTFAIFGDHQSFDIYFSVHYSNILVLFEEGKVSGIYSGETVPGGDDGLQELRNNFIDLPGSTNEVRD